MAGASKAININYIDTVSCFHWCLNIRGLRGTLDIRESLHPALLKSCPVLQPLARSVQNLLPPQYRSANLYVTLLPWGASTVRNQSLGWNNSCFYLCNGCRMTVHILARWSCHKSLIWGLSVGPRCQVVFGHLWLDRSRTHQLSGRLTPSQSYQIA